MRVAEYPNIGSRDRLSGVSDDYYKRVIKVKNMDCTSSVRQKLSDSKVEI